MSAFATFESELSSQLATRSGDKGYALGGALIASLLDLLFETLKNSCLKQGDASTAAARAVRPSNLDRALFRGAVRSRLYGGSFRDYRSDDGDRLVDATFAACEEVGEETLAAAIQEVEPAVDWSL